jgi:hypothetical protein
MSSISCPRRRLLWTSSQLAESRPPKPSRHSGAATSWSRTAAVARAQSGTGQQDKGIHRRMGETVKSPRVPPIWPLKSRMVPRRRRAREIAEPSMSVPESSDRLDRECESQPV